LLSTPLRRDGGFWIAAGALFFAALLTLAMIKTYSYALWFGIPPVAAGAAEWFRRRKLASPWQIGGALVATPAAVSALAVLLAQGAGLKENVPAQAAANCRASADYVPLAGLPPGLVLADIDLGPMLLLETPHTVLAAPYHRLSGGIVLAHGMLAATPDEAQQAVAQAGVRYIVLCGNVRPAGLETSEGRAGLWSRLVAGEVPGWLVRVPLPESSVFTVFEVRG
jgi:hypothetical protein